MDGLPTLIGLLKQLQKIPYLASKNLYRVANYFLTMTPEQLEQFCRTLHEMHERLVKCPRCCAWQERAESCQFCSSPKRDHKIICVVETWYDLHTLEKSGGFTGEYHVLGGALSPLDGITVEDLTIDRLLRRIDGSCQEVILAMNQTPEGEATAALVARALRNKSIKITCLARGVPVGGTLEYMDRLTVCKALLERREF